LRDHRSNHYATPPTLKLKCDTISEDEMPIIPHEYDSVRKIHDII